MDEHGAAELMVVSCAFAHEWSSRQQRSLTELVVDLGAAELMIELVAADLMADEVHDGAEFMVELGPAGLMVGLGAALRSSWWKSG